MNKLESFFKTFSTSEDKLNFKLAHESIGKKVPVISTSSFALDDALSCGGLPLGRIIQYYGPSASGKTLMAMLNIYEAQQLCSDSQQVWIDAEGSFDANWAEMLGVDTSRLILVQDDMAIYGKQCFEMLLGVPKEDAKTHMLKGKTKEGLLDKIINKELKIDVIVLDSLGAIIPPGEDIAAIGKSTMALMARFIPPTFRKLSLEVAKANVAFIVINHKRDSMDMYTNHTFAGGNAYRHALSANIYFEASNSKENTILNENEEKVGHVIKATVEKSKFGPHPKRCEIKVNFYQGVVDKEIEIADLAMKYNVVDKLSSVSYQYGEHKWVGAPKMYEALKNDPIIFKELIKKVSEARDKIMDDLRKEQENKKTKVMSSIEEDSSEQEEIAEEKPKKVKKSKSSIVSEEND